LVEVGNVTSIFRLEYDRSSANNAAAALSFAL